MYEVSNIVAGYTDSNRYVDQALNNLDNLDKAKIRMLRKIANQWWLLGVRGLLNVAFGLAILLWPELNAPMYINLFCSLAIVEGLISIFISLPNRLYPDWWVLFFEGLIDVVVGLFLIFVSVSVTQLYLTIATWSLLIGILFIIAVIRFWHNDEKSDEDSNVIKDEPHHLTDDQQGGESAMGLEGVLSIFMALNLFFFASDKLGLLILITSGYTILFGVMMVFLSFKLRNSN